MATISTLALEVPDGDAAQPFDEALGVADRVRLSAADGPSSGFTCELSSAERVR